MPYLVVQLETVWNLGESHDNDDIFQCRFLSLSRHCHKPITCPMASEECFKSGRIADDLQHFDGVRVGKWTGFHAYHFRNIRERLDGLPHLKTNGRRYF